MKNPYEYRMRFESRLTRLLDVLFVSVFVIALVAVPVLAVAGFRAEYNTLREACPQLVHSPSQYVLAREAIQAACYSTNPDTSK